MKFAEYVEKWKVDCRTNSGPSWCDTQDTLLKLHILPMLGDHSLQEVRPEDISKVINASKAKGHSAKTTQHIYTILFSLFENAVEFYQIQVANPVLKKFHRPKVPKKKAPFMKPEMTLVFLEYVMATRYAVGVWIQALTAMRVNEMLCLKWGDFDWDNNQILIARTFVRRSKKNGGDFIQDHPKNKEQIYVPIPTMLRKFLYPKRGKSNELVMPNQHGARMCYYVYRRFMRKVCDRLMPGIRTAHGLRHSATELWVTAGSTAEDLRRLLNHKSLDATAGYIHRTDDRLQSIAKKIS